MCGLLRRQGKIEGGARALLVGSRPEASTMRFDYGTADGEAHSHTVRLGRVKSVEEAFGIARSETATEVLHLD